MSQNFMGILGMFMRFWAIRWECLILGFKRIIQDAS